MKRLLIILVILSVMGLTLVRNVSANPSSSDDFVITITCRYINIVLKDPNGTEDYTAWNLAIKNEGSINKMNTSDGIKVVNSSNVAIDLSAWATTTGNWSAGTDAGENTYVIKLDAFTAKQTGTPVSLVSATTITSDSSTGDEFESDIAANNNRWVYAEFTVPTSDTSNGTTQTITITMLGSPSI